MNPLSDRFNAGGQYQAVWGSHDVFTHEYLFSSSFRVSGRNLIGASYGQKSRSYSGGPSMTDRTYGVSTVLVPSQNFYFEAESQYCHDPYFSAEWKIIGEPHFVFEKADLSLAAIWSKYPRVKAFSLRPAWRQDYDRQLSTVLSADISLKPERALAGTGRVIYKWSQYFESSAFFSGGKTDDGEGIVAKFVSYGGEIALSPLSFFDVLMAGSIYRADNRDEYRLSPALRMNF